MLNLSGLYQWLLLLLLLPGCNPANKQKPFQARIDGPFMDLSIYYDDAYWYTLTLTNGSKAPIYTPATLSGGTKFNPYSTAYCFKKDSVRTSLACGVSDTLLPLLSNETKTFFFYLYELPSKPMDSLLLFFKYYSDTSWYNQQVLQVNCSVGDHHSLQVEKCLWE